MTTTCEWFYEAWIPEPIREPEPEQVWCVAPATHVVVVRDECTGPRGERTLTCARHAEDVRGVTAVETYPLPEGVEGVCDEHGPEGWCGLLVARRGAELVHVADDGALALATHLATLSRSRAG